MYAVVVLLAFSQGKIAPVEAIQLVKRNVLCVVVDPEKEGLRVSIIRVIWGAGLKLGDRITLKGYVFRDYVDGRKESDFMTYRVDHRSLVFLRPPPTHVSLRSDERFADFPMIAFTQSRHECRIDRDRLDVGGVLFNRPMKHSHLDSVTLNEVIIELKRMRSALGS